jgi:hypothetical protein
MSTKQVPSPQAVQLVAFRDVDSQLYLDHPGRGHVEVEAVRPHTSITEYETVGDRKAFHRRRLSRDKNYRSLRRRWETVAPRNDQWTSLSGPCAIRPLGIT